MKCLFDENISRKIVIAFRAICPGSIHVAESGLLQASDTQLWEYAKSNDFTIVTKDSDFAELSIMKGHPPVIVWVRMGNTSTAAVQRALLKHMEAINRAISDKSVGIVEVFET